VSSKTSLNQTLQIERGVLKKPLNQTLQIERCALNNNSESDTTNTEVSSKHL
jgi:hypothetical protein